VSALPDDARRQLYRALGPCLTEPVSKAGQSQVEEYARDFRVPRADAVRAVKACRHLLRQAAMTNLTAAQFVEDLAALGDAGALSEALLSGYDEAMKVLRQEIVLGTLGDHGKIVDRLAWRVDRVEGSDRGDGVGIPMVVLTVSYLEGTRRGRVTLHMLPEHLPALREMCERLA
jgi:hypothetical protein